MTSHVTPDELEQTELLYTQRAAAILAGDSAKIAEIDTQLDTLEAAHINRVLDNLALSQCLMSLHDEEFNRQRAKTQAREQFFFTYNARKPVVGAVAAQREAEAEFDIVLLDHGFDPAEFEGEAA